MDDARALQESLEAAEQRARAAEERARSLEVRIEVERSARRAGIVDEDAAFRLMELARVERDPSGAPTNVDALVRELAEARPWLRGEGASRPDDGSGPANPPRDGRRTLTVEAIRRMTPEQINAQWEAIEGALAAR
jgi:hypothetical protein